MKAHAVDLERKKQARKPIPEANRQVTERKPGVEIRILSVKAHAVGLEREKQAGKPIPEADRQVAERKLGVKVRI